MIYVTMSILNIHVDDVTSDHDCRDMIKTMQIILQAVGASENNLRLNFVLRDNNHCTAKIFVFVLLSTKNKYL